MLVPEYWSEGRARHRDERRQVTVRRFGWSNVSQAEAQSMADLRAEEALSQVLAGTPLPLREQRVAYSGADGLPIREEVIERHGENVITRNAYGALCLNTPNVCFLDIDTESDVAAEQWSWFIQLIVLPGAALLVWQFRAPLGIWSFWLLVILGVAAIRQLVRARRRAQREPSGPVTRQRVREAVSHHPDWVVRVYGTPAGLRLLFMHRTYLPSDPVLTGVMNELAVDPIYWRMCQVQQCFRARLTPKPWRMGMTEHLKPRPGVWPIKPERLEARREWVSRYDQMRRDFAACCYEETLGDGAVDPIAETVRRLHDERSGALTAFPLA